MANPQTATQDPATQVNPELHQTSALMRIAPAQHVPVVVSHEAPDDLADMSRYFHSLRRRWLVAIIVGLPLAGLVAYAAWYFQRQIYEATAILRVASVESPLVFETADNNRSNPNSFETYRRTQRQWMRSRFVLSRALRDVAGIPNVSAQWGATDPEDWLESHLNVTFPDDSEVMHVSLSGENADGLQQLVNAVVDAYFDEIVFAERNRRLDRLTSLDTAHKKAETELRNKRTEFKQLVERVGTGELSALTIVQQNMLKQFDQYQQHYVKNRFELMQAQNEFDLHKTAASAKDEEIPVSDQELLGALRTDAETGRLKTEKQQILDHMEKFQDRVNGKKNVAGMLDEPARRLKSCEDRLEARKKALRHEMIEHKREIATAGIDALERKIALLTAQEKQLQAKVLQLEAEARQLGKSSIDVEMMRSDIAAVQEVVSRLASELNRTRIEMQSDPTPTNGSTRVTLKGKAEPARAILAKAKLAKSAGAGIAGFFLPIMFIVWLDVRKNRINSGTEVERGLGLSVIGSMPLIPQRVMRKLDGSSPREQYWRTLLTESVDSTAAVLLQGVKSETCRTVMVSSANAGEGKTTLAAHLATSLAGAGLRTALVDFDLRRPALHRVLGLSPEPGVVDLLRNADALESAVQATQIPDLMFIPAGRWKSAGLARLAAADLKRLFDRLRTEFDFVVVDGSPILPVVDTRLIAQHVDAVVLSVIRDVSCTPQVRAACQLLEMFSVPILGVVVTGSRTDGYHSSYGYDPYVNVKPT